LTTSWPLDLKGPAQTFSYPINLNWLASPDFIAKEFLTTEECEVPELKRYMAPLHCHPRIVKYIKAQIETRSDIEDDFDGNVKTRQLLMRTRETS